MLVVLDVTRPSPSDEALLLSFRSHGRLARTPILCVTAAADAAHRAHLLRAGADDCLSAPFEAEELQARVTNVVAASCARAAQERLHALCEQSPDGVFVMSAEGRILEFNEAGCQLLGYPRAEIVGRSPLEFAATDEEIRIMSSTLAELHQRGGVHLIERVMRRKDGSRVLVEVYSQLLPDGKRQSFVRDISARRHVEAELRRAEARAASILATSADAIISINMEGRITGWNQGAEQIFGHSRDEALGAPIGMILPERLRALDTVLAATLMRQAAGASDLAGNRPVQLTALRKNGQEFPTDASISKAVVDGETILTATLRDITEQRRSEVEQRLLSEAGSALLALGFEEAQDKVVRAACESFADLAVLFLYEPDGQLRPRAAAGPNLDEGRERMLGRPLLHSRACAVWRAFETGASVVLQVTQDRPAVEEVGDELLRAVRAARLRSIAAIPLCAGDDCLGVLSLGSASRDFDARDVRLAEELGRRCALFIKNARLHEAERRAIQIRDDILGIVAHDLRNPLNAICLHLNLLLRRRNDAEGRWTQPAEMIRSAALRMDRIIQDLLDVARLESGGLSIEIRQLPASQVLADAVEAQRPIAAAASIKLRLEPGPELPLIWADPHRLLQVFQNLLTNAIKFCTPGGVVTVAAEAQEGAVRFRVSDTGIGIPAEDIPHLFDRFWQASRTDRRGIGLGLFIVKGIIAAHGGTIWVESVPGRGSTFYFTVPTSRPVASATAAPGSESRP